MSRTFFAPAKINLWLRIFAPDQTGYHPLDTLFCAIGLQDEITLYEGSNGIHIDVHGADVGPAERNLAYRAALEFYNTTGAQPQLTIELTKNIPAGAGLGGGSSDAAAVLRALNEMHDHIVPQDDLFAMGARIGSDVPFFLCGSPLAHARGRGEILNGWPPLPVAQLIVLVPSFAIATVEAYRWLDEARAFGDTEHAHEVVRDWHDVAQKAGNDFEAVLFSKQPQLREYRDRLRQSGARIALLSGSGSALFGVYEDATARERAARDLASALPSVRVLQTETLR